MKNIIEQLYIVAKHSWNNTINLSFICDNKKEFIMHHFNDKLVFSYNDISKPKFYKEFDINTGQIINKENKPLYIQFNYPYIHSKHPAKLEASKFDLFNVYEYEYRKPWREEKIDVNKIVNNIIEATKILLNKDLSTEHYFYKVQLT